MVFSIEQRDLMFKLALKNAVKHDGSANPKALIGGFLGEFPDARKDMKSLVVELGVVAGEVNSLGLDVQKEKLLELEPDVFVKKERNIFDFLGISEGEFVKTAFPPGPEKHPHIGHAKSLLLNYLLAKQYNGEFCLRFEDTNPDLVRAEFYDIMLKDFGWLGVSWDELVFASDFMDLYYEHCESLLKDDKAYVCSCKSEDIKVQRETGVPCSCRGNSSVKNLELWDLMKTSMSPGDATVRLKIDLLHKNSTMRDPSIFRVNLNEHARHGSKYRVWPNYDFQNSIMDGYFKITHRIRSKEFEMRNELQRFIQRLFGYDETKIFEMARFNIEGAEASGRVIREMIKNNELIGWDDPSLITLCALRRRGFLPRAIENFVVSTGISKSESVLTWDDLIVQNRRLLDESSDRFFFVSDPVKLEVVGAPSKSFELNLHPMHRKGGRLFNTKDVFFVSRKDFDSFKSGVYRFIELFNFEFDFESKVAKFLDEDVKTFKEKGKSMLHYLPVSSGVEAEVLMPDKEVVKGLCEENVKKARVGDVVQFERFGFCRLDKVEGNKYFFWFTHS
ncbi:glutamate--tRNA ligase [Candidatus Woesearchaeota archaeon]|nr:glutamate--tRNA ligase [Candidatus Woesearchaeota archaeon]